MTTQKPLPVRDPPRIVIEPRNGLSPSQWGVLAFLASEVALFSTLIMAYLIFAGADSRPGGMGGPTPLEVLSLELVFVTTGCLLASSATVHLAEMALHRGHDGLFKVLWTCTILLGIAFLLGTAYEWYDLIQRHHLTIGRNLFGTTFFTLVGFHALHVSAGVIVMLIVLNMALRGHLVGKSRDGVQLVSWYWHYVDVVWIAVFTVVYLLPHLG
jgi:cytochrome c oxidase subunit 3